MLAASWLHNRYTARIQPGPKCDSQSGRRGVVMIPGDFRVADDLYPTPPAVAGWLRLCWLDAGCIIVIQPGYSQVHNDYAASTA